MAKKPLITRCSAGNLPKYGRKKAPDSRPGLFYWFDAWQFPTLAWGGPTLPSALRRFTSEFGMGSGGTTALLPPGKFCFRPRLSRSDCVGPARAAQSHTSVCSFTSSRVPPCHSTKSTGRNPVNKAENSFGLSDQNASGVVRLSLTGH